MLNDTAAVPTAAAEATGSSAFAAMSTPYVHGRSAMLYTELVRAACTPSEHVDVNLAKAHCRPAAPREPLSVHPGSQQKQQQQQKTSASDSSDNKVVSTRSWRKTMAIGFGVVVSIGAIAAAALFMNRNGRSHRPQPASHFIFAKHPFWRRT